MAEMDPAEEKATLYVLGAMTPEESRDFERRMEEEPELLDHVRPLEEGMVVVARACPPKPAPRGVWKNIETAIEEEKTIVFSWEWLRNKGWAAAAAIALGWLIYALMIVQRPSERTETLEQTIASTNGKDVVATATSDVTKKAEAARTGVSTNTRGNDGDGRREREVAATQQSEKLRQQIVELQTQVAMISQSLTQQQALLNDPSRLKFIALAPVSNSGAAGATGISPQLQRALALGMARELGWLGNSNVTQMPREENGGSQRGATNAGGVDFVDLRPNTSATNSTPSAQANSTPVEFAAHDDVTPGTESPANTTGAGMLPAYVAADHVSVALDDSIAPAGSQVTLTAATMGQPGQLLGQFRMSGNPTVVTFQSWSNATMDGLGGLTGGAVEPINLFLSRTPENWTVIVNATLPDGSSNQVQFSTTPP